MRKRVIKELCVEVGTRCNFKCDHCGIGNSEGIGLSPAEIELLIRSVEEYQIKKILFVGGETTLYVSEINRVLQRLSPSALPKVTITTNGYFAKSKVKAKEIFKSILKLDAVQLSYDKYHCKFLPFNYVQNIKLACEDLGIEFGVLASICDPMDLVILKKLWGLGAVPVGISKVIPLGNAKKNNLAMRYPIFDKKILLEKCPGRDKLMYLCGRGFSTCCSLLVKRKGGDALVGHTIAEYLVNPFFLLISENTFLSLAKKFKVSVNNIPAESSSLCVLCDGIFPRNLKAVVSR